MEDKKKIDEIISKTTELRRLISWFSTSEVKGGVPIPIGIVPTITTLIIALVGRWQKILEFSITLAQAEVKAEELTGDVKVAADQQLTIGREALAQLKREAEQGEQEIDAKKAELAGELRRLDAIARGLGKIKASLEAEVTTLESKAQGYYKAGQEHLAEAEEAKAKAEKIETILPRAEAVAEKLEGEAKARAEAHIVAGHTEARQLRALEEEERRLYEEESIKERATRATIKGIRDDGINPIIAEETDTLRLRSEVEGAERDWAERSKARLRLERHEMYWRQIPVSWSCPKCPPGTTHPISNMFYRQMERIWEVLNTSNPILSIVYRLTQAEGAALLCCAAHRPPRPEMSYRLLDTVYGATELRDRIAESRAENLRLRKAGEKALRRPTDQEEQADRGDRTTELYLGFTPERGTEKAAVNPDRRHAAIVRYAVRHGLKLVPATATVAGLNNTKVVEVVDPNETTFMKAAQAAELRVQAAVKKAEAAEKQAEAEFTRVKADKAKTKGEIERFNERESTSSKAADKARIRKERAGAELHLALLEEEEGRIAAHLATARRIMAEAEANARTIEVARFEEQAAAARTKAKALQAEAERLQTAADLPTSSGTSETTTESPRSKKANKTRGTAEANAAKAEAERATREAQAVIDAAKMAQANLERTQKEAEIAISKQDTAQIELDLVRNQIQLANLLAKLGSQQAEKAAAQGDEAAFTAWAAAQKEAADAIDGLKKSIEERTKALAELGVKPKLEIPVPPAADPPQPTAGK